MQTHRYFGLALRAIALAVILGFWGVIVATHAANAQTADEKKAEGTAATAATAAEPEPAATAEHGPDAKAEDAAHGDKETLVAISEEPISARKMLEEFWYNFRHNLFKPLL